LRNNLYICLADGALAIYRAAVIRASMAHGLILFLEFDPPKHGGTLRTSAKQCKFIDGAYLDALKLRSPSRVTAAVSFRSETFRKRGSGSAASTAIRCVAIGEFSSKCHLPPTSVPRGKTQTRVAQAYHLIK
jgi:hypothetical protein